MGEAKARAEWMAKVDADYFPPQERAMFIWFCLQRGVIEQTGEPPAPFDVLFFAAEHVGQMSLAINHPELTEIAKQLLRLLYSFHYSHPANIHGEPDRAKWEEILNNLRQDQRDGLLKNRDVREEGTPPSE